MLKFYIIWMLSLQMSFISRLLYVKRPFFALSYNKCFKLSGYCLWNYFYILFWAFNLLPNQMQKTSEQIQGVD